MPNFWTETLFGPGLDVPRAGPLLIGASGATEVDIASASATTKVLGPLNVTGAATLAGVTVSSLAVSGAGPLTIGGPNQTWAGSTYNATALLTANSAGEANITAHSTDSNGTRAKLFAANAVWGLWFDGSASQPFVLGSYLTEWLRVFYTGSTLSTALTVTGATTLQSTLNVTGTTTLAGATASSLTVTGALHATADFATTLLVEDTRSTAYTPTSLNAGGWWDFKTNGVDGLTDGGSFHGVLTLRQWGNGTDFSGGQVHELAVTDNGNLWHRTSTSTTVWGSWLEVVQLDGSGNLNIGGNATIGSTLSAGYIIQSSGAYPNVPQLVLKNTALVGEQRALSLQGDNNAVEVAYWSPAGWKHHFYNNTLIDNLTATAITAPGVAKAWAVLAIGAAGAVTVSSGFNVASASWSTNSLTVNFTNALADTNYALFLTISAIGANLNPTRASQATNGFACTQWNGGAAQNFSSGQYVYVAAFR